MARGQQRRGEGGAAPAQMHSRLEAERKRERTAMVASSQSAPAPRPRAAEVIVPGARMSGFRRESTVGPGEGGGGGGGWVRRRAGSLAGRCPRSIDAQ